MCMLFIFCSGGAGGGGAREGGLGEQEADRPPALHLEHQHPRGEHLQDAHGEGRPPPQLSLYQVNVSKYYLLLKNPEASSKSLSYLIKVVHPKSWSYGRDWQGLQRGARAWADRL